MTRIGGFSNHYHISESRSESPKLSLLDKLPTTHSQTGHATIPLSETSRLILPESIAPSEVCRKAAFKRELDAILSTVALYGLKDGITGSS